MYYTTLFVGMDVHKENFTVCCYDMIQDKISTRRNWSRITTRSLSI